jgi:hypothetical protein
MTKKLAKQRKNSYQCVQGDEKTVGGSLKHSQNKRFLLAVHKKIT